MRQLEFKNLDQKYYYEKLENGLEIFLVPYKNKNNYAINYVTKYGSNVLDYKVDGEEKKAPPGIAHFLEHKMFESSDGIDPFTFASKSGTYCNAMTSYTATRYLFEGNKNFLENLEYMINFVNEPYFTDENVLKEKGIIIEEVKQYNDDIECILDLETRKSIYKNHPIINDIGGTVETVSNITKEELYDCYNTFYQPSNMFIVVTGNFDVDECCNIIKNNKYLKEKNKIKKFEVCYLEEPDTVTDSYVKTEVNLVKPKLSYNIKFLFDKDRKFEYSMYINMFLSLVFGNSSKFWERMRNEGKVTSFGYATMNTDKHMSITILAETEKQEELIKDISNEFKNFTIKEEDMERLKKVWIASEVVMIDNISVTLDNIVYDVIEYGDIIDNKTELIRKINKKDMDEILNSIDFDNKSVVVLEPNKVN